MPTVSDFPPNPQKGEVWSHVDGGSIYVLDRKPKRLTISRRPFGDSLADVHWMLLSTFNKVAIARIK